MCDNWYGWQLVVTEASAGWRRAVKRRRFAIEAVKRVKSVCRVVLEDAMVFIKNHVSDVPEEFYGFGGNVKQHDVYSRSISISKFESS